MAKRVDQALFCALLAVGAFTLCPAFAEESAPVVAALPAPAEADPAIQRAVEVIHERAQQKQVNPPVKLAKPKTFRSGHAYILGIDGASALPM